MTRKKPSVFVWWHCYYAFHLGACVCVCLGFCFCCCIFFAHWFPDSRQEPLVFISSVCSHMVVIVKNKPSSGSGCANNVCAAWKTLSAECFVLVFLHMTNTRMHKSSLGSKIDLTIPLWLPYFQAHAHAHTTIVATHNAHSHSVQWESGFYSISLSLSFCFQLALVFSQIFQTRYPLRLRRSVVYFEKWNCSQRGNSIFHTCTHPYFFLSENIILYHPSYSCNAPYPASYYESTHTPVCMPSVGTVFVAAHYI